MRSSGVGARLMNRSHRYRNDHASEEDDRKPNPRGDGYLVLEHPPADDDAHDCEDPNVGAQQSGEVEVEEVDHHPVGAEHGHADCDHNHAAAAHPLADERVAQDLQGRGPDEDEDGSELAGSDGRHVHPARLVALLRDCERSRWPDGQFLTASAVAGVAGARPRSASRRLEPRGGSGIQGSTATRGECARTSSM